MVRFASTNLIVSKQATVGLQVKYVTAAYSKNKLTTARIAGMRAGLL